MTDKIKVNHQDPFIKYERIRKIGEGEYAEVYLVKNDQNDIFALKIMKEKLPTATQILEEVNYTYNSDCGNIVKCLEVYCYRETYSMTMEFMDKTLSQVKNEIRSLDLNFVYYVIREIIKGTQFLHSRHAIHRDLKPDNIFIDKMGQVKIGDLGICAQLTRERDLRTTFAGSPLWTAPEIISGQKYGKSCDIWSIGMIFQELIDGLPYFVRCRDLDQLINRLKSREIPRIASPCPSEAQEFFNNCCKYDPDQRLSAESLLQLSLFNSINEKEAKRFFMNFYGFETQVQPLGLEINERFDCDLNPKFPLNHPEVINTCHASKLGANP